MNHIYVQINTINIHPETDGILRNVLSDYMIPVYYMAPPLSLSNPGRASRSVLTHTRSGAAREEREREAKTTPTGGFLSAATSILPVSASPLLPPLVSAHPEETTRPRSPEESFGHGGGGGGSEGMPGRASGGALLGLRRWGGCGGGVGGAAAAAATAAEASAAAAAAGAQPPQAAQQGAPRQHRGSGPSPPLLSSPTNMARIQCTPPRSPSISRFVFSFLFLLWSLAGMEGRKEWIHGGEKKEKAVVHLVCKSQKKFCAFDWWVDLLVLGDELALEVWIDCSSSSHGPCIGVSSVDGGKGSLLEEHLWVPMLLWVLSTSREERYGCFPFFGGEQTTECLLPFLSFFFFLWTINKFCFCCSKISSLEYGW